MSQALIGTSGWNYKGWRKTYYPEEIPVRLWLNWYSERFSTVEINSSFYRTPTLEAVAAWRDSTPDGFVFAWKASKFITHWKRLTSNCRNSLDLMETRLKVLKNKLGPVLFQLPPQFKADRERLASFLKMLKLKKRRQYAFEFRDISWYDATIYEVLADHNVALCLSDHHDAPAPYEETATHLYIRGHGPAGDYRGHYSKRTLDRWAKLLRQAEAKSWPSYCYFDNDQKTAAPRDAEKLVKLMPGAKG